MLLSPPPLSPSNCRAVVPLSTDEALPSPKWRMEEQGERYVQHEKKGGWKKGYNMQPRSSFAIHKPFFSLSKMREKNACFFFFEPLCGMQLGLSSEHNIRYLHLLLLLFPLYTSAADAIKFHSPVLIAGHKIPLRKTLPLPKEKNFFCLTSQRSRRRFSHKIFPKN